MMTIRNFPAPDRILRDLRLEHLNVPQDALRDAITALTVATDDINCREYLSSLKDAKGEIKEEEISDVAALWGFLIWAAMKKLGLRTEGIDKLVRYFNKVGDYESMLYASDAQLYRAHHAAHVFSVFIHGWRLLNDKGFIEQVNLYSRDFSDNYETMQKHRDHPKKGGDSVLYAPGDQNLDGVMNPPQEIFEGTDQENVNIRALWTIAALCHDLGYPLEKTTALNKRAREMFHSYGGIDFADLTYSPNFGQEDGFGLLLRALSNVVHCVTDKGTYGVNSLALFRTQQTFLAKRYLALIDMDHGIASACLVWKMLEGISDILCAPNGKYALGAHQCARFIRVREALAAIADHNNKHLWSRVCNLGFLLRVCDEVSEAARPRAAALFRDVVPIAPGTVEPVLEKEAVNFAPVKNPTDERVLTITYEFPKDTDEATLKKFLASQEYKRRELQKVLLETLDPQGEDSRAQGWKIDLVINGIKGHPGYFPPGWLKFKLLVPNP